MLPSIIKIWADRQIKFFQEISEEIERLKSLDVKYSGNTGRYVSEYVLKIDFSGKVDYVYGIENHRRGYDK